MMKKRKNIWVILFCLLLLGVTVIALFGEGSLLIHTPKNSEEIGLVDKALGMLPSFSQALALN